MTAARRWDHEDHPEDVIREAENEARSPLATLLAIEALRNDGRTDWWEGTAADILGHFDNALGCARALADNHAALLDYVRATTQFYDVGWAAECVKRRAAREAEHPTEEPAPT